MTYGRYIMIKITKVEDIKTLSGSVLEKYLSDKVKGMMTEYGVDDLESIGCFVVLDKSEYQMFSIEEMEFVEVLNLGNEIYLHGVKICGDSYGEDTYLAIGVIEC